LTSASTRKPVVPISGFSSVGTVIVWPHVYFVVLRASLQTTRETPRMSVWIPVTTTCACVMAKGAMMSAVASMMLLMSVSEITVACEERSDSVRAASDTFRSACRPCVVSTVARNSVTMSGRMRANSTADTPRRSRRRALTASAARRARIAALRIGDAAFIRRSLRTVRCGRRRSP